MPITAEEYIARITRLNMELDRRAASERAAIIQGIASHDEKMVFFELLQLLIKNVRPLLAASLNGSVMEARDDKRHIYLFFNDGVQPFHLADLRAIALIIDHIEKEFPELKEILEL